MIRRLRDDVGVPLAAIVAALAVGAILIAAAGQNPFSIYAELFAGTFGSWYGVGQMIAKATPLIFTGLAVAVAFRAGLFNIGAEGQMTAGGLAAALTGLAMPGAPAIVQVPLCLAAAAGAGMATALIPGWLRARRGVHEVVSSIMMNFVVAAAAGSVLARVAVPATVRTETLPDTAQLPRLASFFEALGTHGIAAALRPSPANAAAFLAVIAAALCGWMLFRTVTGFELRVMGLNPAAAATGGVDVPAATIRAFLFSGALAGLGGTSYVMGAKYYYETGFASGAGFMGIAVALLGRNHPAGVVMAALLFGTLAHGGLVINGRIPSEIVNVLQALIILFLISGLAWLRARTPAPADDEAVA